MSYLDDLRHHRGMYRRCRRSCMEVCPEYCILTEPEDLMSFIDPARCTDCGACMAACVINAIYPDDRLPADSIEFININETWFRRKSGVRQRVREIAIDIGSPVLSTHCPEHTTP